MGRGRGPAGEPSWAAPAHDLAPENSEAALLSKRAIWISAVVAAAIVLGSGLVSQLLTRGGPASKAQPSSVATFVGSKTCAGCHQVEQDCGQPRSTRLRCSMRPTRRGLTKPCLEPAKRLRQTATWSLRPQVLGETPSTTLRRSHACDAARRNCIDRGSICLHSTRQRNPTAGRAVGIREVDHIDIVLSQAEVRLLHV